MTPPMGTDSESQLLIPEKSSTNTEYKNVTLISKLTSTRFHLAYLGFIGFFIVFAIRISINVAIVAMVKNSKKSSSTNSQCPLRNSTAFYESSPVVKEGFDWSLIEQARILSAYFYGRLFTQIPAAKLSAKVGGKHILGFGILVAGILTGLIVPAAFMGPYWVFFCRLTTGIVDCGTFTAFFQMAGKWAPKQERTIFSTMAMSGGYLGNVFAFPLVGYLCSLEIIGGWPIAFITIGLTSSVWFVAWCSLAYESPADHPWISVKERELIESNIDSSPKTTKSTPDIPWKQLLTSKSVLGLIVARFADGSFGMGISSCLSMYLAYVLNFNISANGVLNAAPWLACFVGSFLFSSIADFVRNRNYFSVTTIRKYNQILSTIIPGFLLLAAGYSGCSASAALSCIAIAGFFFSAHFSGSVCNVLDLAPKHAGIITSFCNTATAIAGSMSPIVVERIIQTDIHSDLLWRKVFLYFASVSWFGGVIFTFFGSGKIQDWANL
ncbi:sialin-like [Convolutriloba macropyga]|uniref:sialin-like n=1 Tax=Convolutriloba macropyga TaxID=536237 RepID=UPI003F51B3DD